TSNISPRIAGEASNVFLTSAVALVIDPMTGIVLYVDVEELLEELCVKLGFCLDRADRDQLVEHPPLDVDSFAEAVIRAEGLDPISIDTRLRQQVRAVVAGHFGASQEHGLYERRGSKGRRRGR